jgi:hypothetical protein
MELFNIYIRQSVDILIHLLKPKMFCYCTKAQYTRLAYYAVKGKKGNIGESRMEQGNNQ